MPNTTNTRHAVSRSTGATTYALKQEDGSWLIQCLSHSTKTEAASRAVAWKSGSTPAQFCPKCKAITEGKAEKISGGLLPAPTPSKKVAAKKTTPAKKAAAK